MKQKQLKEILNDTILLPLVKENKTLSTLEQSLKDSDDDVTVSQFYRLLTFILNGKPQEKTKPAFLYLQKNGKGFAGNLIVLAEKLSLVRKKCPHLL